MNISQKRKLINDEVMAFGRDVVFDDVIFEYIITLMEKII